MRVKCLAAQEHNTMPLFRAQIWTAQSVGKHTNHEATLHPHVEHITGLEVHFLVHLQSLASKIYSTSKLVRPLANSFQMFRRHG